MPINPSYSYFNYCSARLHKAQDFGEVEPRSTESQSQSLSTEPRSTEHGVTVAESQHGATEHGVTVKPKVLISQHVGEIENKLQGPNSHFEVEHRN